ncbi:hypothetical protein, partial [Treponema endosymbiont of Eucomonympha sp.]|uniref:hypothetical protein n=1 Tax=Treponema endosymbiont of Eucomonympha sp. TaxID=1580831 RepID=UPI00139692DE
MPKVPPAGSEPTPKRPCRFSSTRRARWCRDEDGTLFRPKCYLWLDMRTRLVYGVAFERHYNSGTVLRALRLGVEMFGKFGSTYNDNGSSESSEWTDFVIEQLQTYGMKWGGDAANLYRTEGGKYAVIDDEGSCVELAPDRDAWRKTNRRIFARIKNAKTKPIERFFSSLGSVDWKVEEQTPDMNGGDEGSGELCIARSNSPPALEGTEDVFND